MCRAITEMLQDERAEGREEGRAEGKAETLIKGVESAMTNFKVDLQTACEGIGTTIEEYYRAKEIMELVC